MVGRKEEHILKEGKTDGRKDVKGPPTVKKRKLSMPTVLPRKLSGSLLCLAVVVVVPPTVPFSHRPFSRACCGRVITEGHSRTEVHSRKEEKEHDNIWKEGRKEKERGEGVKGRRKRRSGGGRKTSLAAAALPAELPSKSPGDCAAAFRCRG